MVPLLGRDVRSMLRDHVNDPQAWLADVLARLPDHPAKYLNELLPWNWKANRTAAALAQAA